MFHCVCLNAKCSAALAGWIGKHGIEIPIPILIFNPLGFILIVYSLNRLLHKTMYTVSKIIFIHCKYELAYTRKIV